MTKHQALIQEFDEAVKRFGEALQQNKNEFIRDSAIKRFELAYDLAWKAVKSFLIEQGIECMSPMSCFKEAYRQGLLEYEEVWVEMVRVRNKTVHTYDEEIAEEVYAQLPEIFLSFQELIKRIFEKS